MSRYGWIPDVPDRRDRMITPPKATFDYPETLDFIGALPPIEDQGTLGSCVAHAIAVSLENEQRLQGETPWMPSRLFLYYNARVAEGTVESDSGVQLRDAIKAVAKIGACPEADWPYDVSRFMEKPPDQAYADAPLGKALAYFRVPQTLKAIKACLFAERPVVLGISLYESFESDAVATSGEVPIPGPDERLIGGHCVALVGWKDPQERFLVRNSWGMWGQSGYCTVPYKYILDPDLADDLWVITVVP